VELSFFLAFKKNARYGKINGTLELGKSKTQESRCHEASEFEAFQKISFEF